MLKLVTIRSQPGVHEQIPWLNLGFTSLYFIGQCLLIDGVPAHHKQGTVYLASRFNSITLSQSLPPSLCTEAQRYRSNKRKADRHPPAQQGRDLGFYCLMGFSESWWLLVSGMPWKVSIVNCDTLCGGRGWPLLLCD